MNRKEQKELLFDLVSAFIYTNKLEDVTLFLQDLLTKREMQILSRRLRIAKLLLEGDTYDEIEELLHVSHSTVAKIAGWLAERGDGFRKIIEKLPKQTKDTRWFEQSEWESFKRRYSLYFWPELLLEEIIKSANKKNKQRMEEVLMRLEEKSELHKRIEKLLRQNSSTT